MRCRSPTWRRSAAFPTPDVDSAPNQATYKGTTSIGGDVKGLGFYVQDNWVADGRLALDLGFRFDHDSGRHSGSRRLRRGPRNPTGNTFAGLGTLVTYNDPSPRLGATYKLDSAGKTVAKVSWGRYFGRLRLTAFRTSATATSPRAPTATTRRPASTTR